jgi:DHA1 family arabinose polymer transporter-like MFS transporter
LPVSREGDIKSEMSFFKTPEAWLVLLITAIGTGGLFAGSVI